MMCCYNNNKKKPRQTVADLWAEKAAQQKTCLCMHICAGTRIRRPRGTPRSCPSVGNGKGFSTWELSCSGSLNPGTQLGLGLG